MSTNSKDRRTGHFGEGRHGGLEIPYEGESVSKYTPEQLARATAMAERFGAAWVWAYAPNSRAWQTIVSHARILAGQRKQVTGDALCGWLKEHDVVGEGGRYVRLGHYERTIALRVLAHDAPELASFVKSRASVFDEVLPAVMGW